MLDTDRSSSIPALVDRGGFSTNAGRAHLVGARGAGMKALGELLGDLGWSLSGSDMSEPGESDSPASFELRTGHAPSNVPIDAQLLIHSPAISSQNPERQFAREAGIPELSYTEMLAQLMRDRVGVCVAGTHGKTTTTAMVASILRECGLEPSAAVGGELVQYRRSGWAGSGRHLVVESCEYRRHFLDFSPSLAAILNLEADHFDCFPSLEAAVEAFSSFAALIAPDGVLVVPGFASAQFDEITQHCAARVERFSFDPTSDWSAVEIRSKGPLTQFRLLRQGRSFGEIELKVPGRHNVLNALAAAALASAAGGQATDICEALSDFRGVRRRFEILGDWRGVTVIDDYAHHPTAVRATIQAARQFFGQRRLICVFQPHQVSRTLGLMDEFATCFAGADDVLLVPIFAARESAETALAAQTQLAQRAATNGVSIRQITSLDRLQVTLDYAARPGDVLLIMGAGDINRMGYELTRNIS